MIKQNILNNKKELDIILNLKGLRNEKEEKEFLNCIGKRPKNIKVIEHNKNKYSLHINDIIYMGSKKDIIKELKELDFNNKEIKEFIK